MLGRNKVKFQTLQREVLLLVIALISMVLLAVEFYNQLTFYNFMNRQYQAKVNIARSAVLNSVEMLDAMYQAAEDKLEVQMLPIMQDFQTRYQAAEGRPDGVDLSALLKQYGTDYDYYIIDSRNVIVKTTFERDMGLDFTLSSTSMAILERTRSTGRVETYRAAIGINTDVGVKKYIYQLTPDGKYILEIGAAVSAAGQPLVDTAFSSMRSSITAENDVVERIDIYGTMGNSFLGTKDPLNTEQLAALKRAVATQETQQWEDDDYVHYYSIIKGARHQAEKIPDKVTEIVINKNPWKQMWYRHLLLQAVICLGILVLAISGSRLVARRIARPVQSLLHSVRQIGSGNLHTPMIAVEANNEIGELAAAIEQMRCRIGDLLEHVTKTNQDLTEAYELTIRAFHKSLEHREQETARHSLEVNRVALDIGKAMNLTEDELKTLSWGTLLHDIGKLAIQDSILLKPQALTQDEYAIIRQHASAGYEVLKEIHYLNEAALIALYHHERFDGSGYPQGLAGGDIPLAARICAVADAFEAMIGLRPYKQPLTVSQAAAEIQRCSGTQFDPAVAECLLNLEYVKAAVAEGR